MPCCEPPLGCQSRRPLDEGACCGAAHVELEGFGGPDEIAGGEEIEEESANDGKPEASVDLGVGSWHSEFNQLRRDRFKPIVDGMGREIALVAMHERVHVQFKKEPLLRAQPRVADALPMRCQNAARSIPLSELGTLKRRWL